MDIKTVAVVGAGTMGASIVVALLGAGYTVLLKDVNQQLIDSGLERVQRMLDSQVRKGLSLPEAQKRRDRLEAVTDSSKFFLADLVIEAVSENIDVKRKVFADLETFCRPDAILGTNTSGLSITQIAAFTDSPERVVGLHFFNPAHLMKLVEVIAGLETSVKTIEAAMTFVRTLDKLPVRVEECPSFLVNRLLGRYMNESLWCLQEGEAQIEDLDQAVCNYVMPIGPLALRDMNGADIGLAVAKFNFQEYGERFRPAPILEKMVQNNLLGQKSNRGFYLYDSQTKKRNGANPDVEILVSSLQNGSKTPGPFNVERLFIPMINEAFLVLQEKVCSLEDLDPALMAGLGMRQGPLALASGMGLANCLKEMERLFEKHGERFRPAPLLKRYVWGGRQSVV